MTEGGESGRVLCVDDDREIREVLRDLLTDEGFEVRTAPDGAAALELARRWRPDVILLDIGMPVMDGYAFAREYRKGGGYQAPLVVMTAGARLPHAAQQVGAAAYVAKPFDVDDLIAAVRALLPAA